MGRTLVLPPHQGMYLIDKQKNNQQSKFSFDHFFHMESISNEHIGLNIITTKDFLEQCAQGKIVNAENKPIYPPGMRTEWDGAPHNELKELKMWLRDNSGQNLLHWDPDRCIAAFPASNSEEDAKELASLPQQIAESPGKFPPYENYIGKPNDVDAPAIERLKEMNADRQHLCEYTPELQQTQWLHFPVGMKSEDGDSSRLLVHFYAFVFFQDWKQDLWMKRFVRDHVRYIDEIQCAAARVVAAMRKRVSTRTGGASKDFDTIHIRRGDFQFKETRVDASEILKQLKRVLDDGTTLYIATDERDKDFFKDIVDHYPDVVFLDDMISELGDTNSTLLLLDLLFLFVSFENCFQLPLYHNFLHQYPPFQTPPNSKLLRHDRSTSGQPGEELFWVLVQHVYGLYQSTAGLPHRRPRTPRIRKGHYRFVLLCHGRSIRPHAKILAHQEAILCARIPCQLEIDRCFVVIRKWKTRKTPSKQKIAERVCMNSSIRGVNFFFFRYFHSAISILIYFASILLI